MKQQWSRCLSRWVENWSLIQRHLPFQASPLLRARASRDSNLPLMFIFVPHEIRLKRNQLLRKWLRWLGEVASLALCSSWEAATRLGEGGWAGVRWGRNLGQSYCPSPQEVRSSLGHRPTSQMTPILFFYLIKGMCTRIKWPNSSIRFVTEKAFSHSFCPNFLALLGDCFQLFFFFFFFLKDFLIYLFIYLFFWLCWVFGSCEGFLQLRQAGATLHRSAGTALHRGASNSFSWICWYLNLNSMLVKSLPVLEG